MTHYKLLLFFLLLVFLIICHNELQAQAPALPSKRVIQLSGQVVRSDSLSGLEGVAVYVPGTTRGTYTRKSGYFSIPVVVGDSVVFGALGYGKHYLLIPDGLKSGELTIRIALEEHTTALPMVNVMPWATEYDLKQAVLKTRLPEEPGQQLPSIPPPVAYKSILDIPPMSAAQNFRYGQQQLRQARESRFRAPDVVRIFGVPIR